MKIFTIIILLVITSCVYLVSGSGFIILLGAIAIICYLKSLENRIRNIELRLQKLEPVQIKPESNTKPELDPRKPIPIPAAKAPSKNDEKIYSITPPTYLFADQKLPIPPKQKPSTPKPDSLIISWFKAFLFTCNPIAKVGIVILFLGVAFLLKYAAEFARLPIEARLIGVGLAGIVMIALGWRLRLKQPVFAYILQGGGIGLIYLTVYAAFRLYSIVPPIPAFSLLVLTVIATGILSILQNAKSLAVFGILGGFIAPILIPTADNNVQALFAYYVLLHTIILGIAWFKSWSQLNVLGFIFTFILSALWGCQIYAPSLFSIAESYLILFFLFYNVIAILYANAQPSKRKGYVDAIITFGTPFMAFALQIGLVRHIDHGLAWSAFALFLFYAILATMIYYSKPTLRVLYESFIALALLFGTIAIPLAASDNWTIIAWTIEGLMLLYVGIQQQRFLLRFAGMLLQLGGGLLFLYHQLTPSPLQPFFANVYLTSAAVGLSGLACANIWHYYHDRCYEMEQEFAVALLIWGSLWWYATGIVDIAQHTQKLYQLMGCTLFFTCSSIAFFTMHELINWRLMRYPALLLLPMMMIFAISIYPLQWIFFDSYLQEYFYNINIFSTIDIKTTALTWFASFGVLYWIFYRLTKHPENYLPILHVITYLLLTWVIINEINRAVGYYLPSPIIWKALVSGGILTIMLAIAAFGKRLVSWPFAGYPFTYQNACSGILFVATLYWVLTSNYLSGDMTPLPYIPLLNPLDIVIACALYTALLWTIEKRQWLTAPMENDPRKYISVLFALLIFIWLNAVLLRTIHQYLHISYTLSDLWSATSVQTALSIFWTVLALLATFIATRMRLRTLWFGGALLIALTVAKLFFVDLSDIGTLQRIITFITVGILLLINGYISPLPPDNKK